MKQMLFFIFVVILVSCNDTHKQLYGRWQLNHISAPNVTEFKVDTVFYSFENGVFELMRLKDHLSKDRKIGLYHETTDSLFMSITDPNSQNIDKVKLYFGWYEFSKKFQIKTHTSKKLVLSCNDTLYVFRKF